MERAGYLDRARRHRCLNHATSGGRLTLAVAGSAIGLNILAGDQYVADVIPARTFKDEFRSRGYRPETLSRIVEDNGTVTSVLIPWNTCGAYHAAVLGVATFDYLPYCFFNLINPLLSILYGFLGFRMEKFKDGEADSDIGLRKPVTAGGGGLMSSATRARDEHWYKDSPHQAARSLASIHRPGSRPTRSPTASRNMEPNKLAEQPPEPAWKAFLRQYRDLMQIVLIGVAIISIVALDDFGTGILIFGLTVFNAVLGVNQEGKAAESVAALRKMLVMKSKVTPERRNR